MVSTSFKNIKVLLIISFNIIKYIYILVDKRVCDQLLGDWAGINECVPVQNVLSCLIRSEFLPSQTRYNKVYNVIFKHTHN